MSERVCAVEDCSKGVFCRGWCAMHYYRWLKRGDLNYVRVRPPVVPKQCSVTDCQSIAKARGLCAKHDWRMRTYGDLDHVRFYPTLEDRFWQKVDRSGSCWLWTAGTDRDGYGLFQVDRQERAHRFSYKLAHGEIGPGLVVMHTCDRPPCVNPAHLKLGTNAENCADSARKARRPRGSKQHAAKLTEGQVLAIRERYAAGGVIHAQLAAEYGVSRALISVIITRKAWKHI